MEPEYSADVKMCIVIGSQQCNVAASGWGKLTLRTPLTISFLCSIDDEITETTGQVWELNYETEDKA